MDPKTKIHEQVEEIITAAKSKEVFHRSHSFTGSTVAGGIVSCIVTGPDDLIIAMKHEIDRVVRTVLEQHNLGYEATAHPSE